MIFSRNIIEQIFLTNQKLERNTPQISKTKCIVILENIEEEKKFRFCGVKMTKSNKIEKTEELIGGLNSRSNWE